ncbi:MAG: hypothetical protein RLZZ450_5099 [Pseudomonadota bacterium]
MDYSEGQQAVKRRQSGVDRIGSYSLIAQIAAGDFTTVHLAQRQGTLGYQRLTAIKRLKQSLARQPEWTQLLLDEARLSAGVRHGNIVDIIDVGTDPNSGVYLVMGYVEGADLEVLISRAGKERHPRYLVPPIVDALVGLSAVHTALDELGESLSMVHQAPRARHILVGIDGTARITDFSQVSARGLIPSTLRGKRLASGYMAPEQVSVTEPVSARTDLFIVGITLWETLTGERLFDAENPALARRAILERHIPRPSEVGLRPPAIFDAICMKALQRNPELRYQTAQEMAFELREVATHASLYASASELGQWVRALASRALVERRRALGAEEPSQEIPIDEFDGREPTSVVSTAGSTTSPAADKSAPSAAPAKPASPSSPAPSTAAAQAIVSGVATNLRAGAEAPRPPTTRPNKMAATLIETRLPISPAPAPASAVPAPVVPSRAAPAGSPAASVPPAAAVALTAAAAAAVRASAFSPSTAPAHRPRADEPRAATPSAATAAAVSRVHDAESASVVHAISVDPTPLADDPSRVSRAMTVNVSGTVNVTGPASAPRTAPVGLPVPKATLLGVSLGARSAPAPKPADGTSVPRPEATSSILPPAGAAADVSAAPAESKASVPATPAEPKAGARARPFAKTASFYGAAILEAAAINPYATHDAKSAEPTAESPRRKVPGSATLPEGTALSKYLPTEQQSLPGSAPMAGTDSSPTASDRLSEPPAFTGFGASRLPSHDDEPRSSAGADVAHGELFPAPFSARAPEGAPSVSARPVSPVTPRSGGFRDEPSEPQRTFDGELPADIFARLQAARREATESFRPPAFAAEDHRWSEPKPANGFAFKSLLVAAAITATGVFGFRHWADDERPVQGAVAPSVEVSAPVAPPVAPGSDTTFEDLPGAQRIGEGSAVEPTRPGPESADTAPAAQPLEVVPPPYAGSVPPPFAAPVEIPDGVAEQPAPAPRRVAAPKKAVRDSSLARPSTRFDQGPLLAPRLVRPRAARTADPALPDNPY